MSVFDRLFDILGGDGEDRAAFQLVDVMMGFYVFVSLVVLAPVFYAFIPMVSEHADSFSSLLLQLVVPFLFIALIISMGNSARRGA